MPAPVGRRTKVLLLAGALYGCSSDVPSSPSAPPDSAQAACPFPQAFSRSGDNRIEVVGGDPYPIVSDPFVMHESDQYRMWFTSGDWSDDAPWYSGGPTVLGTSYMRSADGDSWDTSSLTPMDPKRQIRQVLTPGAWDALGVETVTVVRAPTGKLHVYYSGDMKAVARHAIGLATSEDGSTWQRYGDGPIFDWQYDWEKPICVDPPACTQEIGGVLEPSVLYDASAGVFRLWYAAIGELGGVVSYRIGYATSSDGLIWKRVATPVLEPGPAGAWDDGLVSHTHVIADPTRGYHLFYFGASVDEVAQGESCGFTPGKIGHAYSTDGVDWRRNPGNPVLTTGPSGAWDGFLVAGPSALFVGNLLRLWYFGAASCDSAGALEFALGAASTTCP